MTRVVRHGEGGDATRTVISVLLGSGRSNAARRRLAVDDATKVIFVLFATRYSLLSRGTEGALGGSDGLTDRFAVSRRPIVNRPKISPKAPTHFGAHVSQERLRESNTLFSVQSLRLMIDRLASHRSYVCILHGNTGQPRSPRFTVRWRCSLVSETNLSYFGN